MALYFESPATQNVGEAHETLSSWSCAGLVIAGSMLVPDDHVPEEYVNALPAPSTATQKESDTHETAANPCLSELSTFTGVDHAPEPAAALVDGVLPLGALPCGVPDGTTVELEPHAATRNPADAIARSHSGTRVDERPGLNDVSIDFMGGSSPLRRKGFR
jgi:hypothetical protein